MTSWNKRNHTHRHGGMTHAHIGGYVNHGHPQEDTKTYPSFDRAGKPIRMTVPDDEVEDVSA